MIKNLIRTFPSYRSGYIPTFWCFSAIPITIVSDVLQRRIKQNYEREILRTPDGGQIAIDWENRQHANKKQVILILPGMGGSSKENYVTHFVSKAKKMSCIACVFNYRGIEIDLLTPRFYSASNYDDLELVVKHVKTIYPDYSIFAIGISYGGIKLGGYLSQKFDESKISNAMIVSVPYNAKITMEEIEKIQYLVINKAVTSKLIKMVAREKHLFENDERFDMPKILNAKTFCEFDKHFISKQFGHETLDDYYRDCSIDAKLQNIRVPTLFLNSGDDMFSPTKAFPIDVFNSNANIVLCVTKYGGHVSFAEGILPIGCNFACRLFSDYLENVLNGELQ